MSVKDRIMSLITVKNIAVVLLALILISGSAYGKASIANTLMRIDQIYTDNISENTSGVGITIDGVPIKDGTVDGRDISTLATSASAIVTRDGTGNYSCDGVADNVQIQAAIDAVYAAGGGKVVIKEGNYSIASTVNVKQNIELEGVGIATNLALANDVNAPVLKVNQANNVAIRSLHIDGNKAGQSSGSAVEVDGYTWLVTLSDLTVTNAKESGIWFTSDTSSYSYEPHLERIAVTRCGGSGFTLGYCMDAVGIDLYAESNGEYGFKHYDSGGNYFHSHAYNNSGAYGIYVDPSAVNNRFVASFSENNAEHGIMIKGNGTSLVDCYINDNSKSNAGWYNGIVVQDAVNCTVSNCRITDTKVSKTQNKPIVEVGSGNFNLFIGNMIGGNTVNTIDVVGAQTQTAYNI